MVILIFAASEVPDTGSVQNSDIHKGVNGFIGDGGVCDSWQVMCQSCAPLALHVSLCLGQSLS